MTSMKYIDIETPVKCHPADEMRDALHELALLLMRRNIALADNLAKDAVINK